MRVKRPFAAMARLSAVLSSVGAAAIVVTGCGVETPLARLEVYPEHTRLHVSELIRYSVYQHQAGALTPVEDYTLTPTEPTVIRVVDRWLLEAMSPGQTKVVIRSEVGERILSLDVNPEVRPRSPQHTTQKSIASLARSYSLSATQTSMDLTTRRWPSPESTGW